MAFSPNQKYPGATDPNPNYKDGIFRDNSPATTNNGSPLKALDRNERLSLDEAVMDAAGFDYNGIADTPQDSQLFKAYKAALSNGANLISNHNFLIQSPDDSQPPPDSTPRTYPPGFQIFSGVFANETTGILNLTYIDGRLSFSGGDFYMSVPNTGGVERLTEFVASVADFDGKPRTRGVSFALVGDEYRITVGIDSLEDVAANPTPLGSVKFEQGSVPTRHETESLSARNLSDYTDLVFDSVADMVAAKLPVGSISYAQKGSYKRVTISVPAVESDFVRLKEIYVSDYGAIDISVNPSFDSTQAIEDATAYLEILGGGVLVIDGQFNAARLAIRSFVTIRPADSNSALICTDSITTDPNVTFGSFFKKPDNGDRVFYFSIVDGLYIGTALSGLQAAEDSNQNVIGINLCACERSQIDVRLGGFGYGGIVLARAEGGSEGLGFVNTNQDGNYNNIYVRSIAWCGKYNPSRGALWFKYKANSNTVLYSYAKGLASRHFAFGNSNNNTVSSNVTESAEGVAIFGTDARSNVINNPRSEGASGDVFTFSAASEYNEIDGGWITGTAAGKEVAAGLAGTKNKVVIPSAGIYYDQREQYPPASGLSTIWKRSFYDVKGIVSDITQPAYSVSSDFNNNMNWPTWGLFNTVTGLVAGDVLGEFLVGNNDSSAGAKGVSASVQFTARGSGGQTAAGFTTGTGTTRTLKWEVDHVGDWYPFVDNAYQLGRASNRPSELFAAIGTINTSDETQKTKILPADEAEKNAAIEIKSTIGKFKMLDAIAKKGVDNARIHWGVGAQTVKSIMLSHGLDAHRYSFFCEDTWYEIDGNPISPDQKPPKGAVKIKRYGIRYSELAMFILCAI